MNLIIKPIRWSYTTWTRLSVVLDFALSRASLIAAARTCVVLWFLVIEFAGCAGRSRAERANTVCVSGASAPSAVVVGSVGSVDSGTSSTDASYEDSARGDGRFQNPSGMTHTALIAQRGAAVRAFGQCLEFDDRSHRPNDEFVEWPTATRSGTPRRRPMEPIEGWVPLRTPSGAHCVQWSMRFNTGNPLAQFVVDGLRCNRARL